MAGLTVDSMPPAVRAVAEAVAEFNGCEVDDLFVADHTHEELSEGAYSIALEEGVHEWPYQFTAAIFGGVITDPAPGWYLEAGSGWYLACYPAAD